MLATEEAGVERRTHHEAHARLARRREHLLDRIGVIDQRVLAGEEVHVALTLRYGDEENLKGFESVAGILPELMLRGTKQLSYQQLRDELDRLKATLSAGGGGGGGRGRRGGGGVGGGAPPGAVSFSIQAKRDTLPAVLEILRQVLREPALPADQFISLADKVRRISRDAR